MTSASRLIAPLIFGLGGAAVLIGLGVWQLQRLEWKTGELAAIDARLTDAAVALPVAPDPVADRFLPVNVSGRLTGPELGVLTSIKEVGAGFRIIAALQTTEGRMIMVDLGFVPEAERATPRPKEDLTVTGNLLWPDETDGFTPPPDTGRNIWFARDVAAMATALGTEPVLVVVRTVDPAPGLITPLPVTTVGIANDHLQYAITWFSLCFVWLGMTGLLLWRIRQRTD